MKFLKVITLSAIAVVLANFAQAQSGIVKAFLVKGEVTLQNNATMSTSPLERGQEFGEGYTVITGSDSSALLLFSNGASINITPDTKFNIDEFKQDDFDPNMGSFLRLKQDPSRSVTSSNLEFGQVVGEVRKLNTDAGSSFTVNTPVASAGIRGTVWVISWDPISGTFKTTNVEGNVQVILPDGTVIPVPADQTYVIVNFQGGMEEADPEALSAAQFLIGILKSFDIPSIIAGPVVYPQNPGELIIDPGQLPVTTNEPVIIVPDDNSEF